MGILQSALFAGCTLRGWWILGGRGEREGEGENFMLSAAPQLHKLCQREPPGRAVL